jgi:hypothetical protein
MSVNPLGLAILVPSIIFDTFNKLSINDKKKITDTVLPFELNDILDIETVNDDDDAHSIVDTKDINSGSLDQENLGIITSKNGDKKPISLSYIFDFTSPLWKSARIFEMIDNPHYKNTIPNDPSKYQAMAVHIKGSKNDDKFKKPRNIRQIDTGNNSIQYQGVLALHLMNRLILLNRFDVIEQIYENIIKKYLNMDNIIDNIGKSSQKKREFLYTYFDDKKINDSSEKQLDYLIDQIVNFRTYLAPFEGIYINENIMGLIKVLSSTILNRDDKFIKSHLMQEQDKSLGFNQKKTEIRELNYDLYKQDPLSQSEKYENVYRNDNKLKILIKSNKSSYSSQKIFNYNHPSIESIIDIYTNPRMLGNVQLEPISDFKLFYLFTNTQMAKKCAHQWKLLDNTMSFIDVINVN